MPPFRILLVCTGNICRSAAGQVLLTAQLRETVGVSPGDAVEVSSAGTAGLQGDPIHPRTSRVLADLGLDASGFRARRLTAGHLAATDLILTATAEHRRYVGALRPDAATRAFTLREASRLLAELPPVQGGSVRERGLAVARQLAERADTDWSPDRTEEDIADPIGGGEAAHIRAVIEIDRALRPLVAALSGAG